MGGSVYGQRGCIVWTTEPHGETATRHQRTIGQAQLTVIVYPRGIKWYVRRVNFFFGGTEGRAETLDEAQAAAEAAAVELQARWDRVNGASDDDTRTTSR